MVNEQLQGIEEWLNQQIPEDYMTFIPFPSHSSGWIAIRKDRYIKIIMEDLWNLILMKQWEEKQEE